MITLKRINKEKVKCVPIAATSTKKVRGASMFEEPYANIFALARKKSGKTTCLYNILLKCTDKHTRIIIFSATVKKDANMRAIVKHLKKQKNQIETYTSLFDGKENILANILAEFPDPDESASEDEGKEKKKYNFISVDNSDDEEDGKKKRKSKYLTPEVVFVFDDLSSQLRSPIISELIKTNRHYKSKLIISSQWIHDLHPDSIKQLDYVLVFRGLRQDKLLRLHAGMDLAIDEILFEKIYKEATKDKFNFLYIDAAEQSLRRNFNCEYKNILST